MPVWDTEALSIREASAVVTPEPVANKFEALVEEWILRTVADLLE